MQFQHFRAEAIAARCCLEWGLLAFSVGRRFFSDPVGLVGFLARVVIGGFIPWRADIGNIDDTRGNGS
jgi:hypothetical protein